VNRMFRIGSALALFSLIAAPRLAHAQAAATPPAQGPTIPSETVKANTATKGNTEIAKGGFVGAALPAEDDPRQATELSIAAGGLFSSGNARQVALTSIGKLKVRRDEHQLTVSATGNFARAGKTGEKVDTTVENMQGLLRYDYFFTNEIAVFLQTTGRRDKFQGLDLRLNIDPGFAYYFINTKKQILRAEAGYDLQHDIRRDADRDVAPPAGSPPGTLPTFVDKTQTLHNARLFVGYENKLYAQVGFITGLEYLQNISDLDKYRLVFDIGLKSNISDKLAIATTYTMRYENVPLPNVVKSDSIASINLVYTLF
jgi:putative salt-induced outer membrane protein YdiY